MDLSVYIIPMITALCMVIGYIVKKWINDVDNKYIPTIVVVTGVILNIFNSGVSLENILCGAVSGIASIGMYEVLKQLEEGE